ESVNRSGSHRRPSRVRQAGQMSEQSAAESSSADGAAGRHAVFRRLVTTAAETFGAVQAEEVDDAICRTLSTTAAVLDVDDVEVWRIGQAGGDLVLVSSWIRPGTGADSQPFPLRSVHSILVQLRAHQPVQFGTLEAIADVHDRDVLREHGLRSGL